MTAGSTTPPTTTADRGPGRPRSQALDRRILDTVITLIEHGDEVTVSRVVELSGVGRAAIYRRWPSMTELLAAALDHGHQGSDIPLDGDPLENLLAAFRRAAQSADTARTRDRVRMRIRLAMTDRALARAYWHSHVKRRRKTMAGFLRECITCGHLRPDLDIDASIDLINGIFYYQYTARGDSIEDPEVMARCETAVRIAWRGMAVSPDAG